MVLHPAARDQPIVGINGQGADVGTVVTTADVNRLDISSCAPAVEPFESGPAGVLDTFATTCAAAADSTVGATSTATAGGGEATSASTTGGGVKASIDDNRGGAANPLADGGEKETVVVVEVVVGTGVVEVDICT